MSWVSVAVAAVGVGTSVYQGVKAKDEKNKADAEIKRNLAKQPVYSPSEASKNMLADAIASRNAINPATQLAYQQAQQAAANQTANAQRNATSGAEALAVGSAAQNNFQSTIPGLVANQTQFQQGNRLQYNQALENMSAEERYAFENRRNNNNDIVNFYLGKMAAANANKNQALTNGAYSLANIGGKIVSNGGGSMSGGIGKNIPKVPGKGYPYLSDEQLQQQINSGQSPAYWGWYNQNRP